VIHTATISFYEIL